MQYTSIESKGELRFTVFYNTALFKKGTTERFIGYFKQIAASLLVTPGQKIWELEYIPAEEKKRLLFDFNRTEVETPGEKTIREMFEEQVGRTPDKISIVDSEGETLTYGELNGKANRLARHLKTRGIGPECIVALLTDPSLEMFIGILAIIKAGGAYLPISPDNPVERTMFLLRDSRSLLLLTRRHQAGELKFPGKILILDDEEIYKEEDETDLERESGPGNLLYLIYTSGTSGKPKGVLLENRNLVNYVGWFVTVCEITHRDKTILTSSYAFDLGYT
ncbi:MAG: AMP-binding protein, partial [bacterium]|nr:AMP-binding protein [bacterium]